MIRSFISNLQIGLVQAEKRPTKPSNFESDRVISLDRYKHGTTAYGGTMKELMTSRVTDSVAFAVQNLIACDDGTLDKSAAGNSSNPEAVANDIFLVDMADEASSVSALSTFTTILANPELMDPMTPIFSTELYTTYAWDSDSYSLEQQWFRLSRNSSFSAALYLQGLTEVLYTCRGIFANYRDETLHLVIDEEKKVYRLDRMNYRKGITACCSSVLQMMSANDK